MKRTIVCMLMTVVLILSLSVPVWADHASSEPQNIVPLWNADENWTNPGGFVVDTEHQTEGEGCVSITMKATDDFDVQVTFPAVDATDMLYLEFDVYASAIEAIVGLAANSYFEISSSGKTCENAVQYKFFEPIYQLIQSCYLSEGWNHLVIPLECIEEIQDGGEPIDFSNVNFLRIRAQDLNVRGDPEYEFVLKFDHFILTDQPTPPRAHIPSDEIVYSVEGHDTVCSVCNSTIEFEEHTLPEGINPCTFEGKTNCVICGLPYEMFGHSYVNVVDEKYYAGPATCTHGARYYFSCSRCGEMDEHTFFHGAPKGHNPSLGYVFYNSYGHAMECGDCGKPIGEYRPHEMSNWNVVREATETETGYRTRKCMLCSYSESEEIPKITSPAVPEPEEPESPEDPEDPETPNKPQTPHTPAVPVAPSDDGCSAVLVSGAPAMLALIAAAGWMVRKKKQ